ncbi:MAG: TetR/AcrR family transcriptional regulator [Hyphomicrobiales bacterium]|nr:TetR/AcrR family transcriptional regulator [Hyphomicrobiales bacterium]
MVKRKSAEREQEILTATLRVLRNYGVSATSTAKIAAEANCSKETIYNWFGDREGLFAALIRAQSRTFLDVMERVVARGQTIREKLDLYSGALLDMLTGEANSLVVQLIIGQYYQHHHQIQTAMSERDQRIIALGIDLLIEARAQGLLNFDDAEEVFSTFYGLVMGGRQIVTISGFDQARPSGEEIRNIAEIAVNRLLLIYRSVKVEQ